MVEWTGIGGWLCGVAVLIVVLAGWVWYGRRKRQPALPALDQLESAVSAASPVATPGSGLSWVRRRWPRLTDTVNLPPLDVDKQQVPSLVNPPSTYQVDLRALTCSCRQFHGSGIQALPGKKERLCRHLRQAYAERGNVSPLLRTVLLDEVHFNAADPWWLGEVEGVPTAIGWREGDPWVCVYTQSGGWRRGQAMFLRYSFHLDRAQWLEGHQPRQNAKAIRHLLSEWFHDPSLRG